MCSPQQRISFEYGITQLVSNQEHTVYYNINLYIINTCQNHFSS